MSSPGHDELRRWREQGRAPAGSCPFCASRISVIERDGVFVARCSHRGCGARGPKHHDLTRACDLFCCPPQRTAGGMGARVTHLLDEMDEWIARAGEAERAVNRAEALLLLGPRFTDVHMEAAADFVLDELRVALRGDVL